MSRTLALLALAALGAATGCIGSGFDLTDLPGEPLAIVYRTRDESERRVELMKNAKESALKRERGSTYEANYLRLEAAADALGLGRTTAEKAADLLGRMSMVDARHEAVEPFEFAFRGDRPLDWSPDHGRLLFASLRSDAVQLYEWDRASGDVRPLTMGPAEHSAGSYGPDGRLVMSEQVRAPDGKARVSRIVVTEPGGGAPRPLTEGPADLKPEWSPDGRWIAYETRDAAGNPAVAWCPRTGARRRESSRRAATPPSPPTASSSSTARARARAGGSPRCIRTARPSGRSGAGRRDEHDPACPPTAATWSTSTTTRAASSSGCGPWTAAKTGR